jgi:hypothetical protein
MDGQDHVVEVEILNAQLDPFEQTQPAPVQEAIGRRETPNDPIHLLPGQHDRDIGLSFGPGNILVGVMGICLARWSQSATTSWVVEEGQWRNLRHRSK